MSFEERVFKRVWNFFAGLRLRGSVENKSTTGAQLKILHNRLTFLARMLTGEQIELVAAEREGGQRNQTFFLPARYDHAPHQNVNIDFYLFRVLYLYRERLRALQHLQNARDKMDRKLRHLPENTPEHTPENTPDNKIAANLEILTEIWKEFPGFRRRLYAVIYHECRHQLNLSEPSNKMNQRPPSIRRLLRTANLDFSFLFGRIIAGIQDHAGSVAHKEQSDQNETEEISTEMEGNPAEDIRIEARDDEAIGNYTLMHNFEKVETIEEFQGNWRDIDGGDELEEHADALRQTRLSRVLRSDDPTHSVFKADIPGLGTSAEARDEHLPGAFIAYDEWDQRSRSYRSNFCRVYLSAQRNAIPDYYHRTLQKHRGELRRLRKHFYKSVQKPVRIGRQLDGVDPDIDALVERQADLMAGHSVNDRVYIQINKKHHDLALLCLLDISLSTDGFADNRRILDIEKQSLILFGELLNEAGVHFQIDGFASRTRNHCYYHNIKSFEQPWSRGAALLSGVEPRGYTRMGTAIRHAHSLLRRRPERQRWIILLSDGKPNDYDRYEGGYGLADVRQAIREAEREQVRLYCLSVDPRARHHLPHMIGRSRFRVLAHPGQLPEALLDFFVRLYAHTG